MRVGCRAGGAVLAAALAAACGVPGPSPSRGADVPHAIETLLNDYHRQGYFDGTVLVAEGGRVIYRGAFGLADRDATTPFTVSTRLRIGSISKAFVALTVLQLADEGRIALDSTVSVYLRPPDFAPELGRRITVRQLLTHTSGLPDYNSVPAMFRAVQDSGLSEAEIVRRIGRYPLRFEPGTGFGYSNDGYRVLAAVIAAVTGRPWQDAVRERVLAPAGMSSSGYASREIFGPPPAAGFAAGYRRTADTVAPAPYYRESPASGYYSTVEDLHRFDRALYGGRLASPASKALMWARVPSGNAFGWLVGRLPLAPGAAGAADSVPVIAGDGAVYGFYAATLRLPEKERFVALLTNVRARRNRLPDLARGIVNILEGRPPAPVLPSLATTARAVLDTARSLEASRARLAALASADPPTHEVDEGDLNALGYAYLDRGQAPKAVAVLALTADRFPDSANAHDSLGDALLAAADTASAVASYRRSLRLNPANANARRVLARLGVPDSTNAVPRPPP